MRGWKRLEEGLLFRGPAGKNLCHRREMVFFMEYSWRPRRRTRSDSFHLSAVRNGSTLSIAIPGRSVPKKKTLLIPERMSASPMPRPGRSQASKVAKHVRRGSPSVAVVDVAPGQALLQALRTGFRDPDAAAEEVAQLGQSGQPCQPLVGHFRLVQAQHPQVFERRQLGEAGVAHLGAGK